MDRNELRSRLVEAGMGKIVDTILDYGHFCAQIITEPANEEHIPIGASKIGGLPHLPESMGWPYNGAYPLSFIAQINLADISGLIDPSPLPNKGWLYFFYDTEEYPWGFDPKDKAGWKVLYFDGPLDKLRRAIDDEDEEDKGPFIPCSVKFNGTFSIPSQITLDQWGVELSEDDSDAYIELLEAFSEEDDNDGIGHQILGFPLEIQGEMSFECEAVTKGVYMGNPEGYEKAEKQGVGQGSQKWRLLLQMDSDDNAEMMWGDLGMLYFWIKEEDLIARNFDNVWTILQCG